MLSKQIFAAFCLGAIAAVAALFLLSAQYSDYRRTAEIIGQYTRKGSKLYVEGRLQTRKWTDKNGQDHYTTEIIADQMQMLGGKDNGNRGQSGKPGWSPDPPPNPAPQTFDDDIPF